MKVNTILLAIILFSCTTQKKATNYFKSHPDQLAPICADQFPVNDSTVTKDSVRFDTLFIEGEPVILKDSFYIKGDTIVKQVTKECPKVQTIIKTETKQVDHYLENTAKVRVWQNRYEAQVKETEKVQQTVAQLQDKVKGKNKVIWWLIIIVAIETLWIFRKPLISLINPIKAIPI